MNAPEWLTKRGGALQLGSDGKTWFVLFAGQPNYSLVAVPVAQQFGCTIRQTNNGKRIASTGAAGNKEGAIQAGLEDLGKALGWS